MLIIIKIQFQTQTAYNMKKCSRSLSRGGTALFGRGPHRIQSLTTTARYAERMPRASLLISLPPLPHRSRVDLPPGVRDGLAETYGATSVTSTLPSPRPQTNQLRNDVSLVVETAPRRCNHLTRAPIARQASTNPAFNSARVLREREPGSSRRRNFEISPKSRYRYVKYLNTHERNSIKNKRCRSRASSIASQDWARTGAS